MKHRSGFRFALLLAMLAASVAAYCRSVSVRVGGPSGQYTVTLLKWENNQQVVYRTQTAYLTGQTATGLSRDFKFADLPEGVYCADVKKVDTGAMRYTSSVWARWWYGDYRLNDVSFGYGD